MVLRLGNDSIIVHVIAECCILFGECSGFIVVHMALGLLS